MYEEFFGLTKRPFPAVPLAEDFVALQGLQEALDALLQCVARGRGVAVVTGGAGMGKTLLIKRLGSQLRAHKTVVYLGSAGFESRLELLQALLFELDMEYLGLSEHEARLRLTEAARRVAAGNRPLLVLIDEAHTMLPRLFDELRGFLDAAPDGVPLMSVVLCGQFELEEVLADPALTAFNQRVGAHVLVSPLSREESIAFIAERIEASGGGELSSIFSPEALHGICRASDGNLRCLAQLADHALLLGYGVSRRPIDSRLVRDALQDLKELPLQWNDLGSLESELPESSPVVDVEPAMETEEMVADEPELFVSDHLMDESTAPPDVPFAVVEVGAGLDETGVFELIEPIPGWDIPEMAVPGIAELPELATENIDSGVRSDEIPVIDRYALLDRLRELPPDRQASVDLSALQAPTQASDELATEDECVAQEQEVLRTVRQIHEEILIAVGQSRHVVEERFVPQPPPVAVQHDVVLPPAPITNEQPARTALRTDGKSQPVPGRFSDLFTRLSRRREKIARRDADGDDLL